MSVGERAAIGVDDEDNKFRTTQPERNEKHTCFPLSNFILINYFKDLNDSRPRGENYARQSLKVQVKAATRCLEEITRTY